MTTTKQKPISRAPRAEPPAKKKPWFLRWWVWVLAAAIVFAVIGSAARGGKETDDSAPADAGQAATSVTLPDLMGQSADIAVDQLEALGVEADLVAQDDSLVLRASNWEVVGIEPAAGTTVPLESRVLVTVVKTLETEALTDSDLQTLIGGAIAGRNVTLVGGASVALPSSLQGQAPLPTTRLVAVAVDSPEGRVFALFATGGTAAGIEGPILGIDDAAVSNFDWGTAATPDSPVGQFRTAVAGDAISGRLIEKITAAQ